MAFIYLADVWCDECGEALRKRLTAEGKAPADPDNEWSYDSGDFPKQAGDNDESDCPQHCAAGEECLNAIELPSGDKVGLLFGELTRDGVDYVRDAIADAATGLGSVEVTDLWREHYLDAGYPL